MSEVVTKRKADELGEKEVQDKKRAKPDDVEKNGNVLNESDGEEWDEMDKEVNDLGGTILERRTRGVRVDYSKLDVEGQDTDEEDEDDDGDDQDGDDDEDHRAGQEGDEQEEEDAVVQVPNGGDKKAAKPTDGQEAEDVGAEEAKTDAAAPAPADEASEDEKEKEKGGYEDDVENGA